MDIEKWKLFAAFAEIFPVKNTVMLTCQRKGANNIQGTVSFKIAYSNSCCGISLAVSSVYLC
jgi:hypothetical protein